MEQLLVLLNAIAPMSPALQDHLRSILRTKMYSKKEMILQEGQVCKHIYFIKKGLVRIYHLKDGKEVTSWLLIEGDIFISVASFFQRLASFENIEALEDTVCVGFTFEELEKTCQLFPEFDTHYKRILITYYCRKENRDFKMMRQTPEERYAQLHESEPELLARVPLYILASYLDISRRNFTRVRSEYHRQKKNR